MSNEVIRRLVVNAAVAVAIVMGAARLARAVKGNGRPLGSSLSETHIGAMEVGNHLAVRL